MKRRAKHMEKGKHIKTSKRFFIVLLVPFLAILLGNLYAKYTKEITETAVIGDDTVFVVSSDYLTDDATIPEYNVYDNTIIFNIKNNKDENVLITDDNITYTVSSDRGTLSQASGTLIKNSNNEDTITLTSDVLQSCTVTLTTTSPFRKTLRAKFNFVGTGSTTSYKVTDKGYYIILDLYTGYNLSNISIDYTGFKPDTANELISSWTSGTTGTINSNNLEEHAHYELRFEKDTSTGTYNTNSIIEYTGTIDLDA